MKTTQDTQQFEHFIKSKVYDLVKQIATRVGFFEYYFKILPRCKNNTRAFYLANEIYCLIFNEYKYSSYNSFKKQLSSYLKN